MSEDGLTPGQCKAARALLGLSQRDLAKLARVAPPTVANFETGASIPIENNLAAIRTALETAGVEFIAENGGGPGLRLATNRT